MGCTWCASKTKWKVLYLLWRTIHWHYIQCKHEEKNTLLHCQSHHSLHWNLLFNYFGFLSTIWFWWKGDTEIYHQIYSKIISNMLYSHLKYVVQPFKKCSTILSIVSFQGCAVHIDSALVDCVLFTSRWNYSCMQMLINNYYSNS